MLTEPDPAEETPHWREALESYPSMRQVFHALCELGEDEDASELLDFAARQEWMADLARRAANEARLDNTMPVEPETDDLRTTLWYLYAASRVRDVLLYAHQPTPANDSVRELDKALYREPPRFRPVAVDQIQDQPLTPGQENFIKNRCQLRTVADPDSTCLNHGIDER